MTATFSTDVTGLAEATRPDVVALDDGDTYELRIAPVAKNLGDDRVRMLSYNGSIPGPTLRVRQGSEVVVHVRNDGDTEATVHWHGLRLDNAYDGVPFETQPPIEIGGEFTYRLRFPDAGLYWYHPHIREDYGLDMGLYGNIVVEPADADYWPAVDREVVVTLDDVLVEDGRIAAFHEAGPTHVAMGRFGNVMLTGGETNLALGAQVGEVVRFYFTNTANTRLFNVAPPWRADEARRRRQRPLRTRDVRRRSPPRTLRTRHRRRPVRHARQHTARTPDPGTHLHARHRRRDRHGHDVVEHAGVRAAADERRADELARPSRRPRRTPTGQDARVQVTHAAPLRRRRTPTAAAYTCPMHPDVVSTEPGTCPQCGMKLVPAPTSYVCPMHPDVTSDTDRHVPEVRDAARPSDRLRTPKRAHARAPPR